MPVGRVVVIQQQRRPVKPQKPIETLFQKIPLEVLRSVWVWHCAYLVNILTRVTEDAEMEVDIDQIAVLICIVITANVKPTVAVTEYFIFRIASLNF